MALLNYTTKVPVPQTANEIVAILHKNHARQVLTDSDGQGRMTGIKFLVDGEDGELTFRMPIETEATYSALRTQVQHGKAPKTALREGQPERIAWRTAKSWLEVQMALVQIHMATLDQIFLPYMLVDGEETLYDRMLATGFKALPPGRD